MAKILRNSGFCYTSNNDNFVALVELESQYDRVEKLANIDFSIPCTEFPRT